MTGLPSPLEKKNGWTLGEQVGRLRPGGVQRLLNHSEWDDAVRDDVRDFVVETIGARIDAGVPFAWVTADEAYGQVKHFRAWLEERRVAHVPATKVNGTVMTTDGRVTRVDDLIAALSKQTWKRISAGAGPHGQRICHWARLAVRPHWEGDFGHWVLARRSLADPREPPDDRARHPDAPLSYQRAPSALVTLPTPEPGPSPPLPLPTPRLRPTYAVALLGSVTPPRTLSAERLVHLAPIGNGISTRHAFISSWR